jgi:hypothetical protein
MAMGRLIAGLTGLDAIVSFAGREFENRNRFTGCSAYWSECPLKGNEKGGRGLAVNLGRSGCDIKQIVQMM